MALDLSDNKRKRGRPPNALRRIIDASQEPSAAAEGYDADADDAERPRKRGRPSRSMAKATVDSPREKTRPAAGNAEEAPVANTKRKRGRPSLSNGMAGSEATRTEGPSPRTVKRRQRGTKKPCDESQQQEVDKEPLEPELEPESSVRRKRGRPRLQDQEEQAEISKQQQAEEPQPKPRKRGRPSLKDMPPSEIQNRSPKPTKKHSTSKTKNNETNGDLETSRKGRKDLAREPNETQRADEDEPNANEPTQEKSTKRKRRRSGQDAGREEDDDDNAPPSPPKLYTHIAPHVIHVRQSTIKAKWSPLSESSLASISSILHLAHRPILQRLSNTQQRRSHTSAALQLITNRITRKLSKGLPFPPPAMTGRIVRRGSSRKAIMGDDGRSAELDFESVLDAKQALERQLDPALHAVELLTREKERLERELERDYEVLRTLESNARSQAREYRGLLKKAHVLAPTPEGPISRRSETKREDVFIHKGAPSAGGLFDNLAEEESDVRTLALQLSSHMDSMKNNLRQTDGILPQLSRSRAALQDVLSRYLDQDQYEQVVLG